MAATDPYADPEDDPTAPAAFTLPPRAGGSTFLGGLTTSDLLATLGGLLQGIPLGRGPVGSQIRPFNALFPLAQGFANADTRARDRAAVEGLASKYGGQGNPEYDAALETMVQDPRLGSQMLFRAITSANQDKRDTRKDALLQAREVAKEARTGQAGIDATNLMGNIQVPQITSMRAVDPAAKDTGGIPLGTGDTLKLPPPVEDFTTIARPRTTDEMVQGLQALPKDRQGLAAASLRAPLEKQREKDADRFRDAGEAKEAIKALGGPKGLYTASPEELESAGMMLSPGSKLGARLSIIANHRRAGDAKKDAQATRDADVQFRRDYLTGQAESRAQATQFNQDFKTSDAERRTAEAADRRQAATDRLQLGRDSLNARTEEWTRRAGERSGKVSASEQKTIQALASMELWHQQTTAALEKMKADGMLPTGEGGAASAKGWLRRTAIKPNSMALREWQALQPGIVGFDRAILNDIGARAIKAHQGALQFFDSPPTYEGAQEVLRNMREQLDKAKTMVPALIQKAQQREGIGPTESSPQGAPPVAPPTPPPGTPLPPQGGGSPGAPVAGPDRLSRQDPLYSHARARGLSDQAIQEKYKITLVP